MGCSSDKVFNSEVRLVKPFESDWSNDVVKNEPMFFNASVKFAHDNGGPITKAFIEALPDGWNDAVVDSRVHMLMPGWYPAIPGYHHDDVPRPLIPVGQHFLTAGQPDYDTTSYYSEHLLGLVNAHICPTAFALGKCTMPAIPDGELIYRRWHNEVEKLIAEDKLDLFTAPSGINIYFDWQTFHTGTKAIDHGWRWFIRLTRNSDRCKSITNEIRRQVQVYLEFPMEGW
jgi:hypothetical protein